MRSGRLACWDAEWWDHEGAVQHEIMLYFPHFEARSNLQQATMQQRIYMMVLWVVAGQRQKANKSMLYHTCAPSSRSSRIAIEQPAVLTKGILAGKPWAPLLWTHCSTLQRRKRPVETPWSAFTICAGDTRLPARSSSAGRTSSSHHHCLTSPLPPLLTFLPTLTTCKLQAPSSPAIPLKARPYPSPPLPLMTATHFIMCSTSRVERRRAGGRASWQRSMGSC